MADHDSLAGSRPVLDTSVAHNARVWNYWLGGKDNYPSDREVGDHIASMFPLIAQVARADRVFLGRVVRFLVDTVGIQQFLDLGTGLPTAENTHEVAQRYDSAARIVYVDNDPLVLVHARALLTGTRDGAVDYVHADAHDPELVLAEAGRTLDFNRPVALMLLGILNFIIDTDQASSIVRRLVGAFPSGSYVAITHPTLELGGSGNVEAMRFFNDNAKPPIRARTGEEIQGFLEGLELVEPGLVTCSRWRTDHDDRFTAPEVPQYGAVARKS
jgi:hypothetical protein